MYPRGEGGGLSPCWFEGGEGVPTNPSSHLVIRRGQKMQIVPIHHMLKIEDPGSSFLLYLGPGPPSLLHLTRADPI